LSFLEIEEVNLVHNISDLRVKMTKNFLIPLFESKFEKIKLVCQDETWGTRPIELTQNDFTRSLKPSTSSHVFSNLQGHITNLFAMEKNLKVIPSNLQKDNLVTPWN